LGGLSRFARIFFIFIQNPSKTKEKEKKIRANLPNPLNPFSHRIATVSQPYRNRIATVSQPYRNRITTFRNPHSTIRNHLSLK
jgi:hypothetical protein